MSRRRPVTGHIDGPVLRRYRQARARGMSPTTAYRVATHVETLDYRWLAGFDFGQNVRGEVGEFMVHVDVQTDLDAQLGDDDVTGWFVASNADGVCIKNDSTGRHAREWYHPSNYDLENRDGSDLPKGTAKQVRREWAAERIREAMAEDREREYWYIDVTVSLGGVEVGSTSLGGIDYLPSQDDREQAAYLRESAEECIAEALREAERNPRTIRQRIVHLAERAMLTARAEEETPDFDAYVQAVIDLFERVRKGEVTPI